MDTIGVTQLIIILLLILIAAFFASVEAAFSSVNKLRIKTLADEGDKQSSKVYDLLHQSAKMFISILIANIIIVVVATTLTIVFTENTLGSSYVILGLLIFSVLFIILGGIIPKFIAKAYSERIVMSCVDIICVFTKIMTPFTFVFNGISHGLLKLFKFEPKKDTYRITEDELLTLVDASHEEGIIENEERKMIANVVDFGDSVVKDVMVPRTDIIFASDTMSYDELVGIFSNHKYTRIPIYSDSRDNVIGILNLKDLFLKVKDSDKFLLEEIMREPYYTYEYKRTFELFNDMRANSIAISIVLDEYGETAGIVTLEDLIEEIVGEIRDEYDGDEEDDIQMISESEFLIDGNTNVDEINDALGLELEPVEYENIAGHMIYLLDRIPEEGESITESNILLTVESTSKNRIDKIRLEILPEDIVDESSEDTTEEPTEDIKNEPSEDMIDESSEDELELDKEENDDSE